MEEILPCWIGRESAACAVGRGNVQFHQKSMDPRRENWRLSSMGWSEVVREVSMADLIGRPRGDGGRFRPPWLVGVGCVTVGFFFFVVGKYMPFTCLPHTMRGPHSHHNFSIIG